MSNGVKLINYLQPQGEYLTFFSELNSDFKIGDKVFIIGGNYENIGFTDKDSPNFDPFNEYATGYTVLAIDNTDNSNAITLNIQYRLSKYNLSGINTSVFNPKPVYKTEEELLLEPNQLREAYISKSYFKRGEFNGGTFSDGIMGEYNIKGDTSNNIYERDKFVKMLEEKNNEKYSYDYSSLTTPAKNNKLKFNNKFDSNNPASFKNGVFLGGEYQWGKWENKFDSNKEGKIQTLNELNSPFNILDESKFNIQKFSNNNSGYGYGMIVSGNIGKIYENEHDIEFTYIDGTSSLIFNDYIPYQLWKSLESNFKFNFQIRVLSEKNNKIFDIDKIDVSNKKVILKDKQTIKTLDSTTTDVVSDVNDSTLKYYEIDQIIFNEIGKFHLEIYVKDDENTSNSIRNIIDKATILHPDIFGGTITNSYMQGGDVWGGEFRKGRFISKYSQLNWWDGIFNGRKDESFLENVRWDNGTLIDGNWKGDNIIPIKNYIINNIDNTKDSNIFYIDIPDTYKHLLKIGENVFISYIKKSIGSRYFQNFTDQPTENPINFSEFELTNIIINDDLKNSLQIRLELKGAVDLFKEDVSLQYAKISQSYFKKGVWNDGIWESGLRKVDNKEIIDIFYTSSTSGVVTKEFTLKLNNITGLYLGERVEVSNIELVREIEVGIIDGTDNIPNISVDDRGTNGSKILTYIEPLNQTLTILNIDKINNEVLVGFKNFEKIETDKELTIKDNFKLLDIRKKLTYNEKSELTESIWVNGLFKSGAWNGGIFRNGVFDSKLYFDLNNTEIQAIFQSGYWKNGVFNNSTFLSGVWENGTINSGIVSNLFDNNDNNSETTWNNGDTVFVEGTINNVEWRRGLMLKSEFNNGKIINGGIENITFNGGQYTNGLAIYRNDITSNRSGKKIDDNRYIDLSAPSLIYVDGDGWVQLDQPSYFQKDYNVIFKDLDRFPNPLNGQMFDIVNRDIYATKVKIQYSTSGNNPLYLKDEFASLKPILAVDKLSDYTQIDENKYWIVDSSNNRILNIDTDTRKVKVYGKIYLEEDKFNFTSIKFISSATKFSDSDNIDYVYLIDSKNNSDILRRISLDSNNDANEIFDYETSLNIDENITDLKTLVKGSVNETVLCLTSQNRLLYTSTKTNILKSIDLTPFVTNAASIYPLRRLNSNSIDLFVLNNNTISHLILDYVLSNDNYSVRITSPIIISGIENNISNSITTFTSKYNGNTIELYIVVADAEKNNEIFKFSYNDFFNGETNIVLLLNDNALEYPIYRSKMSQNYEKLLSSISHIGTPLILSSSDLFKNTTGFGNFLSQIRLLESSSSNSSSGLGYNYWLYDDITDRLIFVDETLPNQYDNNIDVDSLNDSANRYEIIKMTQGESNSIVYSIQKNQNNVYSIRKTERGKNDVNNSTIFNFDGIGVIYDIVYTDRLFMLVQDTTTTSKIKIVELNQTLTNSNITLLNYYSSTISLINDYSDLTIKANLDLTKTGSSQIGVISISSDNNVEVLEIRMNNTTYLTYNIYNNVPYINDVLIKFEENVDNSLPALNSYSIFFATATGIIKTVSDKNISIPNKFRWSNFGDNLFYSASSIKEIYLNPIDKIIVNFGSEFSLIESKYVVSDVKEEDNLLESFTIISNDVIGLSNSRLMFENSTSSYVLEANNSSFDFNIGRFQQNSTSGIYTNQDFLLKNPKSLVKSKNGYVFFIDGNCIRYYKGNVSNNYDIVPNISGNITDLCYLGRGSYDRVYYTIGNDIKYFEVSNLGITNVLTYASTIKKLSVNEISSNIVFTIIDSNDDIKFYDGVSWNTITSTNVYDDIVLYNDNTQSLLYLLQNNNLFYIEYNSGFDIADIIDIPSNNIISIISENETNSSLLYYDKTIHEVDEVTLDISLRNENFVKLKDFSLVPYIPNITNIFLYNEPVSNPKGIIKQNRNSKSVKISTQLDNISTGTFIKMVAINDNVCYALFNESGINKIYKYDFSNNSVILINNPTPLYRNSIKTPSNINDYTLKPSDLTHYKGKLLVLFQYYNLTTPENYYDAFILEANNNFNKNDISWLYANDNNGDPAPIDNTGLISNVAYPAPTGNLYILFESALAPKVYSDETQNSDYIVLYFGDTLTTGDFLKLTNNNIVKPLVANQYNDLILKIQIPSFHKNAENVTNVTITPDPHTGTGSLNSSSTGVTSITIGGDTIILNDDEIWAVFTNSSSFMDLDNLKNYNIQITSTINSSRITSIPYNTGITDFRVYESSGINIVIKQTNSFDSVKFTPYILELTNTSTGIWEINRYDLNHIFDSAFTPQISFVSPVQPTINKQIELKRVESNIGLKQLFLDGLKPLDNEYRFEEITKGYKVSSDEQIINTLSPYLTSRVLYNTILNQNVSFNNLGTPKTAHFVSSRWNNNVFLGTWDEPTYFNNNILEKYSVFINGVFEGDFYDGFFLGGVFRNNSAYSSNLLQGHFMSDSNNIDIQSGNVDAKYRYDISKMNWKDNKLNFTLEGLYLEGDDYKNYPISLIGKGSWVTIPNLFNKLDFVIDEIWNSKLKIDGKNEITLVIKNPKLIDSTYNNVIVKFLQNREILLEAFEYAEELFGSYKIVNVFKKDENIYVTINSDFNKFDSQGKYFPTTKPKIIFNKFVKIYSSNTYIKKGKAYSDMSIELASPFINDSDNYAFIEKIYLKPAVEIIKSGTYKGYIQIPNYLQVFNTTLNKTDKKFNATFNSPIENLFISDVISSNIDDNSSISIDISNQENVIAHDIMVENSQIQTPTLRKDVYVDNSIFLSGKLFSNVRTSSWLNIDDKGFSNNTSQIGDENNLFTFDGDNVKIKNVAFEGNEYLWIEFDNIVFNVDKYRYITLRGFTGDKSQLIGATRSRVFRIEEVKNNLIKIENPFLYYNDYEINGTNFSIDKLQISKQTMLLKQLFGDNVKCSLSDSKQLLNNTFSDSLFIDETLLGWYYKSNESGLKYETASNGTNGLKATFVSTTNTTPNYKKLYQKYDFKAFVQYDFELKYRVTNVPNSNATFNIYFDGVLYNPNNNFINNFGFNSATIPFSYYDFEDKTVEIAIEILGSNPSSNKIEAIIESIEIVSKLSNETKEFYYGWASPAAFNGGDFYGDFNTIWNAGNFRNGNFNGKWFGSEENRAWNGNVWVESITLDNSYLINITLSETTKLVNDEQVNLGGASVEVGDYIYLKFNSVFKDGKIYESYGGYYGVVEASTSGEKMLIFESIDNIPQDRYSVNITRYRSDVFDKNYLINDFNSNIKINDDFNTYNTMDWNLDNSLSNGTNNVLYFDGNNNINIIDYINISDNKIFSIDLLFNYDNPLNTQPLLSFQDSSSGLSGIKLYVKNNNLYLKYRNIDLIEQEIILSPSLTQNKWYHLLISFDSNIDYALKSLNTLTYLYDTIINTGSLSNNIDISNYDVCFIGKMLNLEADKTISSYTFSGKMDEIKIWNVKIDETILFTNNRLNKFVNKYIPQISAYWNADQIKTLDSGSYAPEEESYFVLKGDNKIVLQDDNNTDFTYNGKNVFLELDFFPEEYTSTKDEYKLLTIEESRELPNNTIIKYYLELILKKVNKTFFYFIIREKETLSNDTFSDRFIYPFIPFQVDYTKDIIFDDIENYKPFYNWFNLILTDTEIYINGKKIGDYVLNNRNVFKYTSNTKLILGKYNFIQDPIDIENVDGVKGFIKNINIWERNKFKDEYAIYRILSNENTDLFNDTDIATSNNLIKSGDRNLVSVPYFNPDGTNTFDNYIYSSENNYTTPINNIDINTNYLATALPQNNWLEGTDFKIIVTDDSVIDSDINNILNINYLLTKDISSINKTIEISNMSEFKFFGKKISDNNGIAKLNVSNNGYLFFEDLILDNLNYPLFEYTDDENSKEYKQVRSTDAIMFHNILDIRSYKDGFVKYADREDEFIIEFYGKSTEFANVNINNITNYYYDNNNLPELFSFYTIRIDKKNSNILFYIRRLDVSDDQKILALRRSDGMLATINDNDLINFNKQPNTKDFVIGFQSNNPNVVSSSNTEYITFVPRFEIIDNTNQYAEYIASKDYDYLKSNYGLSLFKQFNASTLNQYGLIFDNDVDSSIEKQYMINFPTYKPFINSEFNNISYDINEQYTLNSDIFKYNLSNDENETLVSRYSFFYDGKFNSDIWHTGIFVNGLIDVPNFVWKYGIKHNGRLQGGEKLENYAHWLGGYHLGINDDSFVRNLVWLRGIFDGGAWEKGHWLSLDLENHYKNDSLEPNNDWSIFKGGEWYSRVNESTTTTIENLFKDANNGTFGGTLNNWNLDKINNPTLNPITSSFGNGINIGLNSSISNAGFKGKSKILVKRNTEYTVTAIVKLPTSTPTSIRGVGINAIGNNPIRNVVNIGYRVESTKYFYDVKDGDNNIYRLVAETDIYATIKHTFNSADNDFVYIAVTSYQPESSTTDSYQIYNIEMIGENIETKDFDPYDIKNHDSIWHGGKWISNTKETGELDEFENPIYYKYTWQSNDSKLYKVKNNQILTLPNVKSIWLGGLWLRGEFDGGIFANGYWHSVDCKQSSRGYVYEDLIGQEYNSTSSVFYSGKMINSIWYGGSVMNDNNDKLNVIFGDLLNLDSNLINNDFTWNRSEDFKFKKSDFSKGYSNDILGRETFTGYHYDPTNDGTKERIDDIEKNRVRKQVNNDGIMSVYWKRGDFDNGVLQFSHWDSLDLNNNEQKIISEKESKNNSIFRKGLIHYSNWKNGLFYANSSRDRYPLLESDEPMSLFYNSRWEKGYWKAKGLKNINTQLDAYYSSLDTTDDIEITNALFSRSLWDAGVFEGGTVDLSIWRSGVSQDDVYLEYKNSTVGLVKATNISNNFAFLVDGKAGTNSDFEFSTSSLIKGLDFLTNDSTFISDIENSIYRWVGSVDNISSIFVNGQMRGSIWHGGVWQKGMFTHTDLTNVDFFNRDMSQLSTKNDNYQLGIWNRGLWLSGYFSFYDDKIIDKKGIDPTTDNAYLFNNANKNEAGRRSLFLSIDAENITDNNNFIGINSVNFNNLLNTIKFNIDDKNNYASFFMRRMLKERTDADLNIYPNKKPYFSVMNGSVLNGVMYNNTAFTSNSGDEDRYILSLFSTLSNTYHKTASNNTLSVSKNNPYDKDAFIYDIQHSKSLIERFNIPYDSLSPVAWNSNQWVLINNNNSYLQPYLANYNNGFATAISQFPHIWRHNYDERTVSGTLFGDGTIVNGSNGLRMMDVDNNTSNIQVSIAQGNGMKWIKDEFAGEPKYLGNELELNYQIISFFSNTLAPNNGFEDYGTNGFETNI